LQDIYLQLLAINNSLQKFSFSDVRIFTVAKQTKIKIKFSESVIVFFVAFPSLSILIIQINHFAPLTLTTGFFIMENLVGQAFISSGTSLAVHLTARCFYEFTNFKILLANLY
jgi:hypothetical protein